jgi:hypothetical protein
MCERTFVACEHCGVNADDGNVLWVELQTRTERCYQHLDSDGDATGDYDYDEGYVDEPYTQESYMECQSCGNTGGDILDREYSADDCDCAGCEPNIDNYSDPDEICALVRRLDIFEVPERDEPWPPEIEKLLKDRLTHFVPITRERACEIAEDVSGEFSIDMDPCQRDPFRVDTSMEISERTLATLAVDHVAATNSRLQLSIPNTREEVADVAV